MKGRFFSRALALAMALCLLTGAALAEPSADWFDPVKHAPGSCMHLLTAAQLTALAALPSEEVHVVTEAFFQALAGTAEREEISLWKTLSTAEERAARSAELAAYRAQTLPFLKAAFAPGNRVAYLAQTAAPVSEAAEEAEISAWLLGWEAFHSNAQGERFLAMLAPLGGSDAASCLAVTQAILQRWLAEIDHAALEEINGDYQLWLYAPGTVIDYPVVQCGSNSYYLDRLFNRRENPAGTLFIDSRNLPDFADPNTLIYGHHMRDGSMFMSLTNYDEPGYYEAHPYLTAIFAGEIWLIEALAGYVTDGRDDCYTITLSDEDDMRKFVSAAAEKSCFTAPVDVNCATDRLVTLSTCAYNFDNARCVLIGRLTRLWQQEK